MNIFITGGLSGLGYSVARLFKQDGHRVAIADLKEKESIPSETINGLVYYKADVVDKTEMQKAIRHFHATGGLDIIIANAGISIPKAKIPDFDLGRRVIQINVIGVLNTFEPAIEIMKNQKHGQLVALGSVAGTIGLPGTAIYGASKSAVINLCESLEIDLHQYGICVTTIAPGFIDTPLTRNNKHKMPFLLTQEKAAGFIYKAILQKKGFYIFPFPMMVISRLLRYLPRNFYKFIMKQDYLGLAKN